ncbi:hypothetical protein [Streptomyces virginiae]|uniref:hypothetical protein n=1 Tax=Streptomyces virginiae TaxID=1961 RepID=UPI003703458D
MPERRMWSIPADGEPPSLRATPMGVADGWAALTPPGGYEYESEAAGGCGTCGA